MKVPFSWLMDYVNLSGITPQLLADKLVKAGFEVEEMIDLAKGYQNIVIGRIDSIEQHPNADKLLICQVDVGDKGKRQIVTGAHNIAVGDIVPVCLDGAVLPDGKQIFTGKLRGVESEGMFCGGSELALDEADYPGAGVDGIFILSNAFDAERLPLGGDIVDLLDMRDVILDVGVTANRPDTNSVLGIAREVCAVLDRPLQRKTFDQSMGDKNVRDMVSVEVRDPDLCPRYMVAGMTDICIAPSPEWIRRRLRKVGLRPINNVVDVTNYVLIDLGQPMHAFDYRQITGRKIVVRRASAGEHIVTLDGKDSKLGADNLVICNAYEPMALAGIMGGKDSGISHSTTTVLFEAARFKRDNIRRSSRTLGIRSDSSARFEKGIDFVSQQIALQEALSLLTKQGCGTACAGVIDVFAGSCDDRVLQVRADQINTILGIDVPQQTMVTILNRLQLQTTLTDGVLTVVVPGYREDIVGVNDLAEEVIRLYGYDNITSLPLDGMRQTHGIIPVKERRIQQIKTFLSGACGYREMISYSFVSPKFVDMLRLPQDDFRRNVIGLINPLGEELSVMRTTLCHSMLNTVAYNQMHGNKAAKLFEVAKVYSPGVGEIPSVELKSLMMAEYGDDADFYSIKAALDALVSKFNLSLRYTPKAFAWLHPGRCASILLKGIDIGYIGEVHPTVAASYKLTGRVVVAELKLLPIIQLAEDFAPFVPIPKYPAISRDLAFVLDKKICGDDILATIRQAAGDKLEDLSIFDVYEGTGIKQGCKSVAVTLTFRDPDRTLVDDEVVAMVDKVLIAMKDRYGAVLR